MSAVSALALVFIAVALASGSSPAPTPVDLMSGIAYEQDFDALAATGTSNVLPAGWALDENGSSAAANGSYTAGTGSGNGGDVYSFGTAGSPDRALGTLLSGTNTPTIGVAFSNATGATITSLDVAYTGEEWRLGATGRGADRLDFQYSLDASSVTSGTWTDVDALDFSTPNLSAVGAVDGNAVGNRTDLSGTITGLSIPSGAVFWLRWSDFNASGSDDGLAVDDFSLTPHTTLVTNSPVRATCGPNLSTTAGTPVSGQVSATDPDGTVTSLTLGSTAAGISLEDVNPATETGGVATATLAVSGSTPAGRYTVEVDAANDDATPQTDSCTLTVFVDPILTIGEVQGNGASSPYSGQFVTVDGVVTELTRDGDNHGFFLQNTAAAADGDPATSDGIFVFTSRFTDTVNGYEPVVGDEIQLRGRVSEFFDQTELGSATATKIGTGSVTPFVADPPADADAAAVYWEAHEGMQASIPAQSVVDSPTHFYSSTADTEFYVISADSPIAQRANPYAQRAFREAHPLDDGLNGNGFRILVTDEGIKAGGPDVRLTPVHTFQKLAQPVVGGVYYDFGKYSVSANTQPQVADGVDPAQNGAPQPFDRAQAYSIANFNMENLYDYRDDPFDGCDFPGNAGCDGVSPPFDYTPASDAEYQGRETEIAHQIVDDLHSPDVIVVAEAEDQDICSVQDGALVCGTTNNADGQPDDLEELALHIAALGGPQYAATFDRDGADARGIVCAFMYRTDRVSLLPASADDPVLGSSPAVDYRGTALPYDADVSNPKALNALLPTDVDRSTGVDGNNVFTRAVQVAHFRIAPTTALGVPADVWVAANHFTSNPDVSIGQRQEQAAYNAAVVRAIQSQDAHAKVMVAGDLNVYPRPDSDQLHALYDAGLQDLYDTVLAQNPSSAYSYVFEGQAQDLDHQFVTPSFYDRLQAVHEAHINSDWSRVPGSNRGTSDHDPMVSQYGLTTFSGVCELATSYDGAAGRKVCLALDRAEMFAGRGMDKQVQDALDAARHEVAKGPFTAGQSAQLLELIGELSTV